MSTRGKRSYETPSPNRSTSSDPVLDDPVSRPCAVHTPIRTTSQVFQDERDVSTTQDPFRGDTPHLRGKVRASTAGVVALRPLYVDVR